MKVPQSFAQRGVGGINADCTPDDDRHGCVVLLAQVFRSSTWVIIPNITPAVVAGPYRLS